MVSGFESLLYNPTLCSPSACVGMHHAWLVFVPLWTAPHKIAEGILGQSAAGLHAMAVLGRV
jgi:hypothetical protein